MQFTAGMAYPLARACVNNTSPVMTPGGTRSFKDMLACLFLLDLLDSNEINLSKRRVRSMGKVTEGSLFVRFERCWTKMRNLNKAVSIHLIIRRSSILLRQIQEIPTKPSSSSMRPKNMDSNVGDVAVIW